MTAEGKAPLLPLMRLLTAVSDTLCVYVCACVGVCPRSHNKKMNVDAEIMNTKTRKSTQMGKKQAAHRTVCAVEVEVMTR